MQDGRARSGRHGRVRSVRVHALGDAVRNLLELVEAEVTVERLVADPEPDASALGRGLGRHRGALHGDVRITDRGVALGDHDIDVSEVSADELTQPGEALPVVGRGVVTSRRLGVMRAGVEEEHRATGPGEQHGFRQAANIKRALDAELCFFAAEAFKVCLRF